MSDQDLQHLEREIRAWTKRSPERSPGVARTRVLARLEERRPAWKGWRGVAVAAALVSAVLAAGFFLLGPSSDVPPTPVEDVVAEAPSPGLLVYELKSGTKLYLALPRPSAEPRAKNL